LTPERWAQIEELFHRASECEPKHRTTLLAKVCSDDPELRREVEALLSSQESAGDHLKAAVGVGLDTIGFPLVGETISHYRVLSGLGEGGMGLVYCAEDLRLGRRVALKFLPEDSASNPAALGRFEREARSASAMEHPNICPVYEFGEYEGRPFIVMQLLEGQTLRELISATEPGKRPLALSKLLDLGLQITAGLEAAHRQGIIHRDIKPANIFVTQQGQAKILDFGLAKLSSPPSVRGDSSVQDRLEEDQGAEEAVSKRVPSAASDFSISLTGVAMGTAGYMSPEQVRGEKLDARTDLFSFGLVLYEMATGQRPFKGDTGPVLQDAILKQTPTPVRARNPEVSRKLEVIIDKALEKDREARYQSAADLRNDLEFVKRVVQPKQQARKWIIVGGVAAALLIASVMFWRGRVQPPSRQFLPEPKLRQLTTNSFENRVLTGAISPDGKYLAYSDWKGLRIQLVATGEARVVPLPDELKGKEVHWEVIGTWFPDGTSFVVNAHPASEPIADWSSQTSSIWLVSTAGGPPIKLRDNAMAFSVSPDGSLICFGTNKGKIGDREIWLMESSGEHAQKLYATDEESAIGGLHWSNDGKRVLYYKTDASGDTLLSRDLKGGPATTILGPSQLKRVTGDVIWRANGQLLYSVEEAGFADGSACNFWGMRLDAHTGTPIEKPTKLTNWSGFCMNPMSETSDGKKIAFLKWFPKETSYLADLVAGGTRVLRPRHFPLSESSEAPVGWMPDSKAIFFVSDRSGPLGIYRQSLDQDIAELIVPQGYGRNPHLTPDGESIVYLGVGESGPPPIKGPEPVMRVSITGGASQQLFMARPWSLLTCARSPTGQCLIGEPTDDGKQLIVSVLNPVTGRGPELFRFALVVNDGTWFLDLSPDGTRVAATRTLKGPIYVLSLAGRDLQQVRVRGWSNLFSFYWAADGKGLFVTSGIRNGKEILHVDLQGNSHALWEDSGLGGEVEAHPSPDGRHLAFNGWATNSNMWLMENF
jgi:eukaryotic-like serine/threonine-protein kinase